MYYGVAINNCQSTSTVYVRYVNSYTILLCLAEG